VFIYVEIKDGMQLPIKIAITDTQHKMMDVQMIVKLIQVGNVVLQDNSLFQSVHLYAEMVL
jgi:hypothetical protein